MSCGPQVERDRVAPLEPVHPVAGESAQFRAFPGSIAPPRHPAHHNPAPHNTLSYSECQPTS